jgi:hypothetical protein
MIFLKYHVILCDYSPGPRQLLALQVKKLGKKQKILGK